MDVIPQAHLDLAGALAGIKVELALDSKSRLPQLIAGVLAMGPRPVDGVVVESRDDVPVTVVDSLACGSAIVHDDVESVGASGRGDGPAESGKKRADSGSDRVIQVAEAFDMLFGDEERMAVIDGVHVEKRHGLGGLQESG
jgi:hypothetical protein